MPFFLPLVAAGAGIAAGASGLSRESDGFRDFIGQTAEDAAATEEFDRTAAPGQRVERRGMEGLSDTFFGRNQEDIEAAALEQSNKAINNQYGDRLATLTTALKGLNRSDLIPTLGDTQTGTQFGAQIGDLEDRVGLLRKASTDGLDISGMSGSSNEELRSFIAQNNPTGPIQTQKKAEARDDLIMRRQDIMAENTRRENAAQRAYNEGENRATRAHQTQLAMFDRQDRMADRSYQRERDSAKDRQQSIMMLIKGLSQMGAGFAL